MTETRIIELLGHFSGKKLLVVGDVVLDHYVSGVVNRINPEAPVPVMHVSKERDQSGAAGNVAKNGVAMGSQVTLVSVVGEDDTADLIMEAAQREGYNARLISDASRPSIRKTRFMVGGQQLLRVDQEQTHNIDDAIAEQIIEAIRTEITKGVNAIIVSDYAKGVVTNKVAQELMALATMSRIPVAADVKSALVGQFKGSTFISPNVKEAHEYLGRNHLERNGTPPATLARELKKKFATDIYLTLSDQGVQVCTDVEECHVPQEHVVEVADTSGAGDTSAVAMMLAYLAGATPREIAQLANAAGAVVVSKVGAVGVTQDEIRELILDVAKHRQEKDA